MAVTDGLTGLHNRRYVTSHIENLVNRANVDGKPISVMMLDLDFFKKINDTHGHAAGDDVLRGFADRLRGRLRGIDLAARYGGEEFVVVMPDTDGETAGIVAERLRAFIAEQPFRLEDKGKPLAVTVSIGVSSSRGADETAESMLERADKALYEAKHAGPQPGCLRRRRDRPRRRQRILGIALGSGPAAMPPSPPREGVGVGDVYAHSTSADAPEGVHPHAFSFHPHAFSFHPHAFSFHPHRVSFGAYP